MMSSLKSPAERCSLAPAAGKCPLHSIHFRCTYVAPSYVVAQSATNDDLPISTSFRTPAASGSPDPPAPPNACPAQSRASGEQSRRVGGNGGRSEFEQSTHAHPHALRNSTSFRISSADLAAVNFKSRRIYGCAFGNQSSPTEYAC